MQLPRASGILLHPTSLPGRYGIGDLGPEAHAFVDFLAETGQTWWQILPLGPIGYGNSPYQSPSSFAGNPLLISPDGLVDRGWLDARETRRRSRTCPRTGSTSTRWPSSSGTACAGRSSDSGRGGDDPAFEAFRAENRAWLDDYVFFQALRDAHGGQPWYEWEPELVARDPAACDRWREQLADGIRFHEFVQYAFETQWQELRAACQAKGIRLIGDVPIFVAHDSADVWAHPDLYDLDEHGRPRFMAGVPPDYFSETGQLWGNPLYRWEVHAKDGYAWWMLPAPVPARAGGHHPDRPLPRLRGVLGGPRRVGDRGDRPVGPRRRAATSSRPIRKELGSVPLIAEDLGVITPDVEALRDEFDLPGMRVIQFGFDADPASEKHLPHRYVRTASPTPGRTTTTPPTAGTTRPRSRPPSPARRSRRPGPSPCVHATPTGGEIHWDLIRMAVRLGRPTRRSSRCRTSSGWTAAPG